MSAIDENRRLRVNGVNSKIFERMLFVVSHVFPLTPSGKLLFFCVWY